MMALSCETKELTLQWIAAIVSFLEQHQSLWRSHVVDFFQDRLWEALDPQWMDCLRKESVETLLLLPSGITKDNWPTSLKEFVETAHSLSFRRDARITSEKHFAGLDVSSLDKVLTQGMNFKKKHEVEVLAAVIQKIVNKVGATAIVDVGAGQGYLTQVLSFKYGFSVIALDASSHHGSVTSQRAERIKKHYKSKILQTHPDHHDVNMPQTVTCKILHTNSLTRLTKVLCSTNFTNSANSELNAQKACASTDISEEYFQEDKSDHRTNLSSCLVLAGLHACGDLSVTMLRAFLESEEVKAVVNIGCCYNLLSMPSKGKNVDSCGFPLSSGVKSLNIHLGKSGHDLACQSAERWRKLSTENAVDNFEVHAFRAAFQMILRNSFPELSEKSPSVGRLGKARCRQKKKNNLLHEPLVDGTGVLSSSTNKTTHRKGSGDTSCVEELTYLEELKFGQSNLSNFSDDNAYSGGSNIKDDTDNAILNEKLEHSSQFIGYCNSAFQNLGLSPVSIEEIQQSWSDVEKNMDLVGPYWSVRATFGPLLETVILLDRLLFLQEQGVVEAILAPLFNPSISPRNMAIIAFKK